MLNSTFDPPTIGSYNKNLMAVSWQSASATVQAGQTANIDYLVTQDMMFSGLQILSKNTNFGDSVTLQIICVSGTLANGMTICPPNSVLNQFGTNIGIPDDKTLKCDVTSEFPAKLLGGLTIRVIYTSTGGADVPVIVNHKLATVLK